MAKTCVAWLLDDVIWQKAEEEAAKVYEEFVESFAANDEDKSGVKAFVRGGTVLPGQKSHEASGEINRLAGTSRCRINSSSSSYCTGYSMASCRTCNIKAVAVSAEPQQQDSGSKPCRTFAEQCR